ncbi:MAG: beta-ketoacyl-ACP synthase III [Bdellovibrionota bacterium]
MRKIYKTVIDGIGCALPEKIVTNDDLAKVMDTSDEWIRERTGIRERRVAEADVGTSDLGVTAAKEAIKNAKCDLNDIDLVIAATLSPDYNFPGIGVLIQDKLGLKDVAGFDVRAQCSGFAWGLSAADAFIGSGQYKKILLVGAEIHSKVLEFSTWGRYISVLFGDAAGAAVLSAHECVSSDLYPHAKNNQERGIIDSLMGSDGSGATSLAMLRPGMAAGYEDFVTLEDVEKKSFHPVMEGQLIYKNAVRRMSEASATLLERNSLNASDLDLLIPHQANLRISEALRKKLGLPEEKVINNIQKYGNTTAATLPLCMDEAIKDGRLKPGSLVMTVAFGAGFTWGANLIRW